MNWSEKQPILEKANYQVIQKKGKARVANNSLYPVCNSSKYYESVITISDDHDLTAYPGLYYQVIDTGLFNYGQGKLEVCDNLVS